jgi:cysteine desulfurase family protein (TIGR01976 family)
VGATVRWADFDPATGAQLEEHFAPVVTPRTRLVAMTAASNLIGTRPPVRSVSHLVHEVGALLWVDGVHATAHDSVDVGALGADFWTCSPYKLLGPHCGVVAAADPGLLDGLHPDKLLPSTDEVPERFELGTLPYELMAGTTAAVDFIAGFAGPGEPDASRRDRILASYAALHEHEERLRTRLEEAVRAMPGVRVYSNAERRTPTLLFTIDGHDPQQVRRALAEVGINAPAGHFYAVECSRHLGLGDEGGVRVGLAPYTDDEDIDRLIAALDDLTG